ncbi:MAG TPA: sigma-70 family RNA polymerase sigma factor [Solirubrobacterales bacterium]|nr:sigma-70 family RNA polymerase sigma factor [Solirubrobacterales bacterium]
MATALMTTPTQMHADSPPCDWVERLRADGPEGRAAVSELHGLLLRAARFEVARRSAELAHLRGGDQEDLAQQAADDATMAVLRKLDDFRGESRFTTWAYKFALLEAAVKARGRAWQGREVPLEDTAWAVLADAGTGVGQGAENAELLAVLREEIQRLSPRRREVLVAVALNGVPIDVLAERLGSNRGALYKNLHDARRKLREALAERGFRIGADREEER